MCIRDRIEAPSTAISLGESVVIKGTVLDQSSAQAGTACVSEESMGEWMAYLHKQLDIPSDITGVSVSLDVVDPSNNFVHITDVTTDGYSGTFGFTWQPEAVGQYTVTATFMGDGSYGSSFATTYVSVTEATEPEAASEAAADNTILLYSILIGVIIAIIISIYAALKKQK